ncbi:MAG: AAA family ATPase [Omnitrophica WOR_2 bacterium]
MKCPRCGFDSPPEMIYCGMCGNMLARTCPACGFNNPSSYRFCGKCGTSLADKNPVPTHATQNGVDAAAPVETPIAVEEIAPPRKPADIQLQGERRVATVILADVTSSTDLMERIGSEAWVNIMNRTLRILESEVYRFGGSVDQFRGDGLVAFFGATAAHEDDPERAILAGLSMQQAIKSYAGELEVKQGIVLKLRVGINTGELIVTSVGDFNQHREDTAMGEAVAIASRMETAAEPGTVLVSENTYRLVEPKFKWFALGDIVVKGVSRPMPVYRPLAPQLEAERAFALLTHGVRIPPTGRAQEFETLKRCIEDVQGGRGGIVMITGDKGIGKSYLVVQARQYMMGHNPQQLEKGNLQNQPGNPGPEAQGSKTLTWLQGHCRSYEQAWPYMVWIDTLQNWLGIHLDDPREDQLARLRQKCEGLWGDNFEKYYPYLATLLSLPLEDVYMERVKRLDAEGLQKQFFQTIRNWLEALVRQNPLVIHFSDLHWVDSTSLELIKYCLALCDCEALLWLLIYRAERASPVWDFQHTIETDYSHRITAIKLAPLNDEDSNELIQQFLGHGALSDKTRDYVIHKSEGNPYFIREMIQALIAKGVIAQDPESGSWQEKRSITSLDLPGSLQSMLLARIDRLSVQERQLIQMAAVIGPIFWRTILENLVDNADQLQNSLTSLQRANLIHERYQVHDLGMEYAFTSSLLRDVAYESLLSTQRAFLHLKVAEFLEECIDLDSREQYESLIAYHYRQAGNPNRELLYTFKAADQARDVYANAEALDHYTRTLELLDEMEAQATSDNRIYAICSQRFEVLNGRAEVYYRMGNIHAGETDARALLPLARRMIDDQAWLVDAYLRQPEVNNVQTEEDLEAGIHMVQEALAASQKLGDRHREMRSVIALGQLRWIQRDPAWLELSDRALELVRQLGDRKMEVNLLIGIASAFGMDDLEHSKPYLEAALSICQKLDDKYTELNLLGAISPQYERAGDYFRVLTEYNQKRLAISREIGDRLAEGETLMYCAQVQGLYLGDHEASLVLAEEASHIWQDMKALIFPRLRIAQIQTALGRYDDAAVTLERSQPLIERYINHLGRTGLYLVSAILHNRVGGKERWQTVLELAEKVNQIVSEKLVSRQYQMAAACEATAAYLGLAGCSKDVKERHGHNNQALTSSQAALDIYNMFGFAQIVECVSEEIFFRHSLALKANGLRAESKDYLKRAYTEMMRKHDLIPPESPFRQTYLDNILLHRQIKEAYER